MEHALRMKTAFRTQQPLKTKLGALESSKKDKPGWKRNGVGDVILWTADEEAERKSNKEAAMMEREKTMVEIRLEFPGET